ncbi:hypothetical protein D3C86_1747860 [compost metagenome]
MGPVDQRRQQLEVLAQRPPLQRLVVLRRIGATLAADGHLEAVELLLAQLGGLRLVGDPPVDGRLELVVVLAMAAIDPAAAGREGFLDVVDEEVPLADVDLLDAIADSAGCPAGLRCLVHERKTCWLGTAPGANRTCSLPGSVTRGERRRRAG